MAWGSIQPEIKTGYSYEQKSREFVARNIGFAISNALNFNWDLIYQPVDSVFQDKNINYTDGIKMDESTDPTDSYTVPAIILYAAYAAISIPVGKLKIYTGLRVEKNNQTLEGLDRAGRHPINITMISSICFHPLNMSYNLTEKSLFRFAYGTNHQPARIQGNITSVIL